MFSGDQLTWIDVNKPNPDHGVRNISDTCQTQKRAGNHAKSVRSVRKKIGSRIPIHEEVFAGIHRERRLRSGAAPIEFGSLLKFSGFGAFSSFLSSDISKIKKNPQVDF